MKKYILLGTIAASGVASSAFYRRCVTELSERFSVPRKEAGKAFRMMMNDALHSRYEKNMTDADYSAKFLENVQLIRSS